MWTELFMFAAGLVALYFGAEWLVRGSARLARTLGMSALVVGLTVVAFGTSSPELVVSGIAAAQDRSDVALGNVLGSNILNIALILGLAAVLYPIHVRARLLRREIPIMIAAVLALAVLALDGMLGRVNAFFLLVGLVFYIGYAIYASRRENVSIEEEFEEFESAESMVPTGERRIWDIALAAVGIAGLTIGAQLIVTSAVSFARVIGISELVIGLTIISVGTSLPELATVLVAAFRQETDIALGNAVGSNIFNTLAILGVAATIRPIPVASPVLHFEIPVMLLFSAALLPFAWTRLRLERWEGALFLIGYIIFTWLLIARAPIDGMSGIG